MNYSLCLSPEGNFFSVYVRDLDSSFSPIEKDLLPSTLRQAADCKSHKEVLQFLEKMQADPESFTTVQLFRKSYSTRMRKIFVPATSLISMRRFVKNNLPVSSISTTEEMWTYLNDPEVEKKADVTVFGAKIVKLGSQTIALSSLIEHVDRLRQRSRYAPRHESSTMEQNVALRIAQLKLEADGILRNRNIFTRFFSDYFRLFAGPCCEVNDRSSHTDDEWMSEESPDLVISRLRYPPDLSRSLIM